MKKIIIYAVVCVLGNYCAGAQTSRSDSAFRSAAYLNTVALYDRNMKEALWLNYGSEYLSHDHGVDGFPYFGSERFIPGTLIYDGIEYSNVPLLYDLVLDQLVTLHSNNIMQVRLINEQVGRFVLGGHTFMRHIKDSLNASSPVTGFYDLLYDGGIQLLARRKKELEETFADKRIFSEFVQKNFYYIRRKETFYPVKSKASLWGVLQDRKKEVKRYLKKTGVKFRMNKEQALLLAVRYYDKISGNE